MQFTAHATHDVTVHFVLENQSLDMVSPEVADYLSSTLDYKGKLKSVYTNVGPKSENVVLVGVGEEKDVTRDRLVEAAHAAAKELNKLKVEKATVKVKAFGQVDAEATVKAVVEGVLQADYVFDTYKKDKSKHALKEVSLSTLNLFS